LHASLSRLRCLPSDHYFICTDSGDRDDHGTLARFPIGDCFTCRFWPAWAVNWGAGKT
jgi:hypothetical protein